MKRNMIAVLMICSSLIVLTAGASSVSVAETLTFDRGWGPPGFHLVSQKDSGVEIIYSMGSLRIEQMDIEGEAMDIVAIPGVFLPNDEGAPNLPGLGRYIALPQGAVAQLEVVETRTQVLHDLNIVPAPPIPREDDDSSLIYTKDPVIYNMDAFYPQEPIVLSRPLKIRGVDVVILGITPFQYNPVSKELVVYTDVRIRVTFQGGNGHFGDDRYRSRYWEPVLQANLLNYASLPKVDFNRRPLSKDGGYEYVIIVPDDPDFIAWADTIKHWRTLQGISTGIFTLTETGSSASEIESWIDNAYQNWQIDAVLLLSDYPGSGKTYGITSPKWNGYCVSDNIYADVDGDDLPNLTIARITAQDAADLEEMVTKFLDYERDPYTDPGFYDHPVVAGGWQTSRWFILCSEIIYGFLANELGKDPVREYAIYSGTPGSIWSTNPNTFMVVDYFGPSGLGYIPATPGHLTDWGGDATRLNNDINSGCFIVQHRDHGSETGWGEPSYHKSDLDGLSNDMLPFVFSINCLTGKYDWENECFTEKFHRMQHGALGLIAASEVSYSFVNDVFVFGMYDCMWPEFDPGYTPGRNIGPANLRPGFAQASGKFYLQTSGWPYNPEDKEITYHLFHMHGDAFTTLYSEVPQALSVSHPEVLLFGAYSFPVTADDGSVIALTVAGEIIGVKDGTGGTVNVPIEPQTTPGTMVVTVTKFNHYRYEQEVEIVPPIELEPSLSRFGRVKKGYCSSKEVFHLSSLGTETVIGTVTVRGVNPGQFRITQGEGAFSLDPGDTLEIWVKFCPTSWGPKFAFLVADGSNCGDDLSLLSGWGAVFYPDSMELQEVVTQQSQHSNPCSLWSVPGFTEEIATDQATEGNPRSFVLFQNYPNPFNPESEISYALPNDCHVKLSIYNLLGQRIRILVDENQAAGHKTVHWDGTDDNGNRVASGNYFYRIQAGEFTEIKKMILMK